MSAAVATFVSNAKNTIDNSFIFSPSQTSTSHRIPAFAGMTAGADGQTDSGLAGCRLAWVAQAGIPPSLE
jgi:hypothetical protein